ncbi:aldo/keto reductase [Oceanobacillus locisalsi]|uniref:Aldo/keto reductase n=1 Tax=Oceanobacillus locisalsi TaxID=546107 RepID=A0ABW3NMH0_9BACI
MLNETYTLSNGVKIPKLGFGTWKISDKEIVEVVKEAMKIGYRHIDTAQDYGNERGVGEAIRTCNIARKDIFVTTKLEAHYKTYEEAKTAIEESLNKMKLDYIDMIIIHSPQPWNSFHKGDRLFEGNLEAWRALEDAYSEGKFRAIGLSNFEQEDIQNILDHGTVKPVVNQILAHVSNTPFELIDYCQTNNILVQAFSPIGHGEIFKNDEIKIMAEKYNVSIPQLAIRYCLQLGLLPLPKSEKTDHIRNNAEVDFEISNEDMKMLKNTKQIEDYGEFSSAPVYGSSSNNK